MCGIIGYVGNRQAAPILTDGLASLEYRGYDSVGIAVLDAEGQPQVYKTAGKLPGLRAAIDNGIPKGRVGLGHTRWATHGSPADYNAHPHVDCRSEVVVVHNGIVENYVELKQELIGLGHEFTSDTDSECIPHLIEHYLDRELSLEESVRETATRIRGANAVAAICRRDPDRIVAFRLGNAGGIVVGYGEEEMLLASDIPALLPHTRDVAYLAPGEVVSITSDGAGYTGLDGSPVHSKVSRVSYSPLSAAKGEFRHFMLKEIHEQPEATIDGLRGRVSFDRLTVDLEDFPYTDDEVKSIERVVLMGMGTSLHAAMEGRFWIESLARIPAQADYASEFRYRDPVLDANTLVVSVCQSGETADTLAAMEEATRKGARQITLCNYPNTQATRVADSTIFIRAGLEICVAGTKTFTSSLTSLYLLALFLGMKRGTLDSRRMAAAVRELARLPTMLGTMLTDQEHYEALAKRYARYSSFLYLGRGGCFPLAMEGALKLKEVSYIHAEGYQAGEMKHGPISLIDEEMPVVMLVPRDGLYEKMLSNVNEVKARGGIVIAVATEGDADLASRVDDIIYVPEASSAVTPILMTIPMQLLAYYIAVRRGCDVDQPRNLAKTVTVE